MFVGIVNRCWAAERRAFRKTHKSNGGNERMKNWKMWKNQTRRVENNNNFNIQPKSEDGEKKIFSLLSRDRRMKAAKKKSEHQFMLLLSDSLPMIFICEFSFTSTLEFSIFSFYATIGGLQRDNVESKTILNFHLVKFRPCNNSNNFQISARNIKHKKKHS